MTYKDKSSVKINENLFIEKLAKDCMQHKELINSAKNYEHLINWQSKGGSLAEWNVMLFSGIQ